MRLGSNPATIKEAQTIDANKTVNGDRIGQNQSPQPHIIAA